MTDADLVLGRIDAARFAGGRRAGAGRAPGGDCARINVPLQLEDTLAAHGISEIVDETMANAARVHAVERGKAIAERTLIAFGGAAPLHAARLAEKLGITKIIVPAAAGVGRRSGSCARPSPMTWCAAGTCGWPRSIPTSSIACSRRCRPRRRRSSRAARPARALAETRVIEMRFIGQGTETSLALPVRALEAADAAMLQQTFHAAYAAQYGRSVAGVELEILTIALRIEVAGPPPRSWPPAPVRRGRPSQSNTVQYSMRRLAGWPKRRSIGAQTSHQGQR